MGNMGDSLALACELNASSVFPRKERERTSLPARSADTFSLCFPSLRLFRDLCQMHGVGECLFLLRKQLRLSAPHSLPLPTSSHAHCGRPGGAERRCGEGVGSLRNTELYHNRLSNAPMTTPFIPSCILLVRMTKKT